MHHYLEKRTEEEGKLIIIKGNGIESLKQNQMFKPQYL